jgi:hypothetical protein
MWKPLSIVSGLLLLVAGGIMFTQIRGTIQSERKQLAAAKANKESALANQQESKKARAQSDTDLDEAKNELAKNTRQKNEEQARKDAKVQEVGTASGEKDAAAKALAEIEEKLKGLGGLERLVADLNVLKAKKATLESSIVNTKGAIESTVAHKQATDEVIAALKLRDLYQKSGTMVAGFRSRVAAVNPDLGFVVLAHGNASNVTKGAKFDVYRGSKGVARLVVTHLEQNRAIAEVIPGTVAAGDGVQPGDLAVVSASSTPTSLSTNAARDAAAKPDATKQPGTAPATPPATVPTDPFATPAGPEGTPPAPEPGLPADSPAPAPAPDATAPAPDATAPTPPAEEMKPENK